MTAVDGYFQHHERELSSEAIADAERREIVAAANDKRVIFKWNDDSLTTLNPMVYNVMDYGCTGDGITNDTAGVQAAVDACFSGGGGTVYFPAGTYLVTSIVKNWTSARTVFFLGAGMQATYIGKHSSGATTTPLFDLSASISVLETYSGISNMKFTGNVFSGNPTFTGVRITQMAYFRVDRIYVDAFEIGIDNVGTLVADFYEFKLHHNNIGIRARKSGSNVYSNLNNFYGCKFTGNAYAAVDYDEGIGVYFTGCDIESNGMGQKTYTVNTATDVITLGSGTTSPPTGTVVRTANSGGALPVVSMTASTFAPPQFTLTLMSTGYTDAIVGDIGKTVVSGAKSGTLVSYDNAVYEWVITTTDTFVFGNAVTITAGTGAGTAETFTTETVTFGTALDLPTGSPGRLPTSGTLPGGLATGTDYYLIRESSTSYRFAASMANARLSVPDVVAITSPGTGTHTFTPGLGAAGTLTPDFDYWWIKLSGTTGKLASSYANAIALTAMDFTGAGTGTHTMGFVGTGAFIFREHMDRETAAYPNPGLSIVTIEHSHFESNRGRTLYVEPCRGLTLTISKTVSLNNESTAGGCAFYIDGCRYFEAHGLQIGGPAEQAEITSNCNVSDLHNCLISTLTNNAQNPNSWNRSGLDGLRPGFSENVDLYSNKAIRIHQNVEEDIYHSVINDGSNNLRLTASAGKGIILAGVSASASDIISDGLHVTGQIKLKFEGESVPADNGSIFTSADGVGFRGIDNGGTYAFVFYSSTIGAEIIRNPVDTTELQFMGATLFNQLTGATSRLVQANAAGYLLASNTIAGDVTLSNGNLIVATTKTPASASDTGITGMVCWDANYVYVCTATNTWKRTAIATW